MNLVGAGFAFSLPVGAIRPSAPRHLRHRVHYHKTSRICMMFVILSNIKTILWNYKVSWKIRKS